MVIIILMSLGLLSTAMSASLPGRADPKCIDMTEDNKAKLNALTDEIVDFLADLAERYQYFDIESVKITIGRRNSDGEGNNDTDLEFTVKDCGTKAIPDDIETYSEPDDTNSSDGGVAPIDGAVSIKPDVILLNLPKKVQDVICCLKEKGGPKPFLMFMP